MGEDKGGQGTQLTQETVRERTSPREKADRQKEGGGLIPLHKPEGKGEHK